MAGAKLLASGAALIALAIPTAAGADTLVTSGSPTTPFPQNKQNEPGLALDQFNPSTLAAGANEEIDNAACGTGLASNCPFTPGVGGSGIYFSPTTSLSFTQPTYSGFTARDRVTPQGGHAPGPIGTVPNYFEAGLVSDGDPTLAFGPVPDSSGHFSYSNGSRLYYSNLTANTATVRSEQTVKGFEAIAVSRTDNLGATWSAPAIVSQGRQSSTTFSDKPTVWADNAASSPFFGRVYVCYTQFKSQQVNGPAPVAVSHSSDGGVTWSRPVTLSASANNKNGTGRQGCVVKTDSHGRVYVLFESTKQGNSVQLLDRSDDGGSKWDTPRAIANVVDVGQTDPVSGDPVFDGIAGARTDSFPSMDIANGAPTGTGASDTIGVVWSDARDGTGHEHARAVFSTTRGDSFPGARNLEEAGDRPDFPAIALSPDGAHVYVTYDNFLTGFQTDLTAARPMQGKVRAGTVTGPFTTKSVGTTGDARGSSANALDGEFIGDYNWIVATNSFAVAVYNDVRNAADCPAVDAYRQALADGGTPTQPSPAGGTCQPSFGNSDIFAAMVTP
jgi:BNR repeat-like domain